MTKQEAYETILNLGQEKILKEKHGRWEKNIRGDYSLVCSECGYGLPLTARDEVVMAYTDCNRQSEAFETASCIQDLANYCPYCGAKMDGDSND